MKLPWHHLACPRCLSPYLSVEFTGTCLLTHHGSEDIGDHEWGEDSNCTCRKCDLSAPVRAFDWYEKDVDLEEDDKIEFGITVSAMISNGEGYTLANGQITEFYDVEVLRYVERTGVIDPIEEYEFLGLEEACSICTKLRHKYWALEPGEEWI